MRFEKQFFESRSFNEAGEKSINVRVDAEIILSVEEAEEILSDCTSPHNDSVSALLETVKEAKSFLKENS